MSTPSPKPWYTSRLVWLGILQIGASVATAIASGGLTTPVAAAAISGALTIILRATTTQAIGAPAVPEDDDPPAKKLAKPDPKIKLPKP